MEFYKYFEDTSYYRHNYIHDAPNDYVATLLKELPISKSLDQPILYRQLGTYISPRTNILLYVLHKLNIRPS